MYWIIDGLNFGLGVTFFIVSIVKGFPYLCFLGIIWICIYPLLLEGLYNLIASCSKKVSYKIKAERFVYSQGYNISFCGIQKLHPFDSKKYGNIYKLLLQRQLIDENEILKPSNISRSFLLQKMSKVYLLKLCYSLSICSYIQMPLCFLPSFLLRWRVLNPMLKATQGSILSVCSAIQLGWSINLSGGFHHASYYQGGGFCIYPDISLSIHYLKTRLNMQRIMVVDLDAHQGNGHQRDHINDSSVFIADFYNHYIYPDDQTAMTAIRRDVGILPKTNDEEYIKKMDILQKDMDSFKPQFVIYNAGTDILAGDRLGQLNISQDGIIRRDQKIIRMCRNRGIPVAMFLSGGYQKINADVIANSIQNLLSRFK